MSYRVVNVAAYACDIPSSSFQRFADERLEEFSMNVITLIAASLAMLGSSFVQNIALGAPSDASLPMQMSMSSSVDLNDPMTKEGSGTSWLPSSTPTYASMLMKPNGDMLMVHGAIMPRYTDVGSKRGDRKLDAPNWAMGMFSHPLDTRSQLGLHLMMSLDPITEGGYGYPLLFQTGETWHQQPLHDRQHPHDLFAEASATYSRKISGANSVYFYAADPGEPALGPPAYMHRLIAYDLADAPIGHHWQDATHITYGVLTAGLNFGSKLKFETSDFTGREPDENRYNFDKPRWDSYSGRMSYSPDNNDAYQVSYGFIRNPEGDGADVDRTTASWIYDKPLGDDRNFTTTLVWGRNDLSTEGVTDSYLAEADYQRGKDTLFTRMENIQKSGHELVLPAPFDTSRKYDVGAYTVGYVRDLTHGKGIDTGLGFAVTVDTKPSSLDSFYGSGTPVGFQLYLRLRPSRSHMGEMKMAMSDMPMSTPPAQLTPALPEAGPLASPLSQTATGSPHSQALAAPPSGTSQRQIVDVANIDAKLAESPAHPHKTQTLVLMLTGSDGNPVPGATVTVDVAMTSMDMGTTHPAVKDIGKGQYEALVSFAMAGPWMVTVTAIAPGSNKPAKASFTYDVRP